MKRRKWEYAGVETNPEAIVDTCVQWGWDGWELCVVREMVDKTDPAELVFFLTLIFKREVITA